MVSGTLVPAGSYASTCCVSLLISGTCGQLRPRNAIATRPKHWLRAVSRIAWYSRSCSTTRAEQTKQSAFASIVTGSMQLRASAWLCAAYVPALSFPQRLS